MSTTTNKPFSFTKNSSSKKEKLRITPKFYKPNALV